MNNPESEAGGARQTYVFGDFRLEVRRRLLTRGDVEVPLTSRPFDVLVCLVTRAGELVTKRELMDVVRVLPSPHINVTGVASRRSTMPAGNRPADRNVNDHPRAERSKRSLSAKQILRSCQRRVGKSVRKALAGARNSFVLAYLWRSLMIRTTVVAITGSVGKSTCKELLFEVLRERGATHKTPNNENDLFGLPGVLLGLRPWHRFAVIELAASGPGTLKRLARLVRPDVAIVTSVARTHTNRYSGIQEIAEEKAELLRHLRRNGVAVLNGDDEHVRRMRPAPARRLLFYGQCADNDLVACDARSEWPDRLSLTVSVPGPHAIRQEVRTKLVGVHWTSSVMAAITASWCLGVPVPSAAAAIARVPPFRGRMQPVRLPNGAVMIRDENASVDVLRTMLEVARSAAGQRRILVLGDVTDSGIDRARRRAAMFGTLVASSVDVAVFVGRSGRHAASAAIRAGLPERDVHHVSDLAQADRLLRGLITPADLIFVKGLGSQHLSRLVFARLGSIGCWVERCAIRKDCDVCPSLHPRFDLGAALRWAD